VLHTVGISIYENNGIVFLDTAGSGNPVPNKKDLIIERKLADHYIQEVVKHTSQGHIHVINRMNHNIQEMLIGHREVGKKNENIMIIHNFRGIKTLDKLKIAI